MEAPRVNASMLPQYTGRLVCLVGNVTEVSLMENLRTVYSSFLIVLDHTCCILAHKKCLMLCQFSSIRKEINSHFITNDSAANRLVGTFI